MSVDNETPRFTNELCWKTRIFPRHDRSKQDAAQLCCFYNNLGLHRILTTILLCQNCQLASHLGRLGISVVMAPARARQPRKREQPKRSAGPPRPVYVPEAPKPRNRSKGNREASKGSNAQKPVSSRNKKKKKTKKTPSRARLGSMDSILFDPSDDPLDRQDRWIPDIGERKRISATPPASRLAPELWTSYCALDDHINGQYLKDLPRQEQEQLSSLPRNLRPQPRERPSCVDGTLWMVYRMMDGWIFRASLSGEEAVTYPLLDDVMQYQCEGGDAQPIAPEGWKWEDRELVQTGENVSPRTKKRKAEEQHVEGMDNFSFKRLDPLGTESDF